MLKEELGTMEGDGRLTDALARALYSGGKPENDETEKTQEGGGRGDDQEIS